MEIFEKVCSSCKRFLPTTSFYKDNRKKDRFYSKCKECKNIYKKEYSDKNKDKVKKYDEENKEEISRRHKNNYYKNRQNVLKRQKLYNLKNKDKINERRRKLRKEIPKYKIRDTISRRINCSVKNRNNSSKKLSSIWKILNYKPEDLVSHLEKQFESDMNWDNYGKLWVIDHLIPDSWFEYDSYEDVELIKSWNIKNLRPCYVEENLKKSNCFAGTCKKPKKFEEFKNKEYNTYLEEILNDLHP